MIWEYSQTVWYQGKQLGHGRGYVQCDNLSAISNTVLEEIEKKIPEKFMQNCDKIVIEFIPFGGKGDKT